MVEINFTVEKDANGVFSGLDLAREMIANAYQLLAAYVDGCPACADDLFLAFRRCGHIRDGSLRIG
jgi:hypothetical protein